jgi:hypothetical protein
MPRFPTPKHFEPTAMPTQDRLWLNHLNRIKKARPKPRHPYEKSAITAAQSKKAVPAAKRWLADGGEANSQPQAGSST